MRETKKTQVQAATEHQIAKIATSVQIRKAAVLTTQRKLGGVLYGQGEAEKIAEDALSTVTLAMLKALRRGTSKLELEQDAQVERAIGGYLLKGIENYCNSRLRRWSNCNEDGRPGYAARIAVGESGQDEVEFWEQHADMTFYAPEFLVDLDSLDVSLQRRGVSDEDILYIKDRILSGATYQQLAEKYGGTADKYRRRIQRAFAKMNFHEEQD